MSSRSDDFQFELTETLYFDRGDEVLELIGITLNPEIRIQTYDSYVSIKGDIELHGEYKQDDERSEDDLTYDDFEAKRYVEEISRNEDDTASFSHRFPVDISIPANRVEKEEDLRIEIIDFDYELPTSSKLQFTAVAEIQGISAGAELELQDEAREIKPEERKSIEPGESFEFEVTREETMFEKEAPEETENEVVERSESPAENELTIRAMEEEEDLEEGDSKTEVKDVSYLTDIFRKEEEESYTKMKICIVQDEDTIESIAERFQISALQLIKQNKLDENFDIREGQLLYIPKK